MKFRNVIDSSKTRNNKIVIVLLMIVFLFSGCSLKPVIEDYINKGVNDCYDKIDNETYSVCKKGNYSITAGKKFKLKDTGPGDIPIDAIKFGMNKYFKLSHQSCEYFDEMALHIQKALSQYGRVFICSICPTPVLAQVSFRPGINDVEFALQTSPGGGNWSIRLDE